MFEFQSKLTHIIHKPFNEKYQVLFLSDLTILYIVFEKNTIALLSEY